MASLKAIEKFVQVSSGSGYGYGSGSGSGDGYGDGYSDGYSDGDGYGYGSGDGYSDGYGYGYGSGDGVKEYNGQKVYVIDDVATIITAVRGNVAKGYILGSDMSLAPCYVVKSENVFAHGKSLRTAMRELESKRYARMDTDEVINEFVDKFRNNVKYSAKDFYLWHNRLTGSCEMGRQAFARDHGIDIERDEMTVKEFIHLTENAYGGEIIKKLKERYV